MNAETRASTAAPVTSSSRQGASAARRPGWLRRTARVLGLATLLGAAVVSTSGCFGAMENVQVINDPFLGPTRGFVMYLDFGGYTAVSMKEAKGNYTLQVMVVQHGVTDAVAAVGDKTDFLVGGKVITLENAVAAAPVANANRATAFTQWQLTFKMDQQQARQFAQGPLSAVKARVGAMEFQVALSPAKAVKFQQNLELMTSPAGGVASAPAA